MRTMLTFKEKEVASKILREAESLDTPLSPEWAAWFLFALGGFVVMFVCLTTAGNLSSETIRDTIRFVLLPGGAVGLFFLLAGGAITQYSRRIEEKKIVAGLLKKLMC